MLRNFLLYSILQHAAIIHYIPQQYASCLLALLVWQFWSCTYFIRNE